MQIYSEGLQEEPNLLPHANCLNRDYLGRTLKANLFSRNLKRNCIVRHFIGIRLRLPFMGAGEEPGNSNRLHFQKDL